MDLTQLFISSVLTNNIALALILGMCPLIAISTNVKNAVGMGAAVVFVVTLTGIINWPIYQLLVATKTENLSLLVFIITIAATVQFLEIFMEKNLPALYRSFGIFLPLITVNCVVLAVSLFFVNRNYDFAQTAVFSFGSSLGWLLAIFLVAGIRQKVFAISDVPRGLVGKGIVFVIMGILSLAFIGFTGLKF
jgi:Na+-transporting NADH:ubiquinone oxidoreductase subunit E